MFYDRSDPGFPQWHESASDESPRNQRLLIQGETEGTSAETAWLLRTNSGYDRSLVDSVWEFAEVVPGNDPGLWRKDESGEWIHRLDYGNRGSEFGWEIFDPGVGRHVQGVFAMRPMQWQNFLRQFDVFG